MASFLIDFEFDIVCADCGADLDVDETEESAGKYVAKVSACEVCMNEERKEGFNEGYEEGLSEE